MNKFLLKSVLCLVLIGAHSAPSLAEVARFKISAPDRFIRIEFLQDNLIHFELSAGGPGPDSATPIGTTLQVAKTDFAGPHSIVQKGSVYETDRARVELDTSSFCISVTDRSRGAKLTTLCPLYLNQAWKGLSLTRESIQHLYGLGEQFVEAGTADGDWLGKVRSPGGEFGNAMVGFNGGAAGNAQFPILYAQGLNQLNYALFIDHFDKLNWDFRGDPWKVETAGQPLHGYLILGDDLPALRRQYMDLVGHPLVPPRKAFGLWVSEYGYSNWGEIDDRLASLRSNGFPIDGFVLDLQWFGGVIAGSDRSPMGNLRFDESHFPDPAKRIKDYAAKNIGLITIEESYISRGLPEHSLMEGKGYLAKDCPGCGATYISGNPWWGKGGIIDWTHPMAGSFWHDLKRQPLIDLGILGHWTDLGEPEMYNPAAWYWGFPELQKFRQADIHNAFNLKWHESIYQGYQRNHVVRRPFLLSRSGAAGIQRFGAAMWSGDIGSKLGNLAAHLNAQFQMSFSGVDYFGADIGGFHRGALDCDLNDLYTQWFANGASFDVPVRPHTENLCKCKQTSPDRIGDLNSNRENIRTRYELIPYYYSLAYRAHLYGEPVMPPPVYYYQNDPNLSQMGSEKLIGRDLLVGVVARAGEKERDVYLPAGDWIDYFSNSRYRGSDNGGRWIRSVPEYRDGIFRLPIFVRSGAIIPKMLVDSQSIDAFGHRADGSTRNDLIVRVYGDNRQSQFTLYEDDGSSVEYLKGRFRTTQISQGRTGNSAWVKIEPSTGDYEGAPSQRDVIIEWVGDAQVRSVRVNTAAMTRVPFVQEAPITWSQDPKTGLIRVHCGKRGVGGSLLIELAN